MAARARISTGRRTSAWAVCLAAAVAIIHVGGLLQPVDELLYDSCPRWHATALKQPSEVVLVYASYRTLTTPERAGELVRRLRDSGAAHIGIAFDVGRQNRTKDSIADVVYGVPADVVDPADRSWGSIDLLDNQSVYRMHYHNYPLADSLLPSLETRLAERNLVRLPSHNKQFRIAFRGGPNSLPWFDERDVLGGELVSEIVYGKTVLLGIRVGPTDARVSVPGTRAMKMSTLELHGQILHTLLTNSQIYDLPRFWPAVMFGMLTFMGHVAYQRLPSRMVLPACICAIVVLVCSSWALLCLLRFWLPCTAAAFGQLLCCVILLKRRLRFLDRATTLSSLRQQALLPQPGDRELWESIAEFTMQMFDPTRAAFLELPRGATHAKVVRCEKCNESNILERRRDIRRLPYSQAVEQGGPVECARRQFFRDVTDEDSRHELIVPLHFAGDLRGFMVLEFAAGVETRFPEIGQQLRSLASIVSGALVEEHQREEAERSSARRLGALAEEEGIVKMLQLDEALQQRLTLFESQFEQSSSGLAIFDAYGRLQMMNSEMHNQLQQRGLGDSSKQVADLVVGLSRKDRDLIRTILREVAIHQRIREVTIPGVDGGPSSVLYMSPLSSNGAGAPDASTNHRDAVLLELAFVSAAELTVDREPVDDWPETQQASVREALARAIATTQRSTSIGQRVAIESTIEPKLPFVCADPASLEGVFESILKILEESAREESTMFVVAESEIVQVSVAFANQSTLSSTEQLRQSLGQEESLQDRLRTMIESRVHEMSARLKVTSNPREGTIVQLVLPALPQLLPSSDAVQPASERLLTSSGGH